MAFKLIKCSVLHNYGIIGYVMHVRKIFTPLLTGCRIVLMICEGLFLNQTNQNGKKFDSYCHVKLFT